MGRDLRSIWNIRFIKGSKLRIVFVIMTAGMLLSAFLSFTVMNTIDRTLSRVQAVDPSQVNLVEQIRDAISGALSVGLIFNIASALIAVMFGLMISHRFNGPVVPLKRHMGELIEGKYSSRVRLRPGDELEELMTAQNALAEHLEKKG